MSCATSGMEAFGVSLMQSKDAVHDTICGPLTSLGWCAAQMDVKDSVLLAFDKASLAACKAFVFTQSGASKINSLP